MTQAEHVRVRSTRLTLTRWTTGMLDRLLGLPILTRLGMRLARPRLRVLAMHGVADVEAFDRQLSEITRWATPVRLAQILDWLAGGPPLPPDAVWVTFDDGERSTAVDAAPVLARHGIGATLFVCPAFVEGQAIPWWKIVEAAIDAGEPIVVGDRTYWDRRAVTELKRVPDPVRRTVVDSLKVDDHLLESPRTTLEDLAHWREMGGDIGNHSWDHPCLDQCDEAEQLRQIDRAGAWLDGHGLWDRRAFAYPNGDRTPEAERHLRRSSYEAVVLFDHRLVRRAPEPWSISRLRLDAGAPPERTRAILSGLHSGATMLRERLRASRR